VAISGSRGNSNGIVQTSGVIQEGSIIATADLVKEIQDRSHSVSLYRYSDDTLIGAKNRNDLYKKHLKSCVWTKENGFETNKGKQYGWFRDVIAQQVQLWVRGWTIGVLGFDSARALGIFLFTTAS
jgi:hypothetical protein